MRPKEFPTFECETIRHIRRFKEEPEVFYNLLGEQLMACRLKLYFLLVPLLLFSGCGNRADNPVGEGLVTRSSGNVVELAALPVNSGNGSVRFENVFPLDYGFESRMLVGRMNGLIFRSLIKIRINADSLAISAGLSNASDLSLNSLSLRLWRRSSLTRGDGEMSVHHPESQWNEFSVFADTLNFLEIDFPFAPTPFAVAKGRGDSLVTIEYPLDELTTTVRENTGDAQIDLLVAPLSPGDFLTGFHTKDDTISVVSFGRNPTYVLTYTVGDSVRIHQQQVLEDMYWAARDGDGPAQDVILLSTALRYTPIWRFDLPSSIPPGASVTAAQLLLDVDEEKSLFQPFAFGVNRIEFSDTGVEQFNTFNTFRFTPRSVASGTVYEVDELVSQSGATAWLPVLVQNDTPTLVLDISLPQSWISGEMPNNGIGLRSRDDTRLNWIVFRNPRLKLVYSTPPDK